MTSVKKRGYDPEDLNAFSGNNLKTLKKAAQEIQFLIDRGYKIDTASEFVSNHYLFSLRQRNALKRSLATSVQYRLRKEKLLPLSALSNSQVFIDGFNLIITLEVALSGSILIKGSDGAIRDLAGLRGTYKIIDKTHQALHILGEFFSRRSVREVNVFLDSPVSNSGRLKTLLIKVLEDYNLDTSVSLVGCADTVLMNSERVISSDSVILDNCRSWFNIVDEIIKESIKEPFLISFD